MTMPALMMLKLMLPLSARAAGAVSARPATAANAIKAGRNRCETRMVILSLLRGVRFCRRQPRLFPRRLAQGGVDALLPAGAVFLEEVQYVAVDAQRHHFLGAGYGRLRRRQIGRLGGRGLEGLLGLGAGIAKRCSCHGAHANLSRARARAFYASTARSRAGACVCSATSSLRAACDTSSTASAKAASLACEGLLKPDSLRTNCSAEA